MDQNKITVKSIKITVKMVFRCGDFVLYYKTPKGIRDLPGGHINFGETTVEALKRELKEEIDFNLNFDPPLLHVWTYISKDKSTHRLIVVYLINLDECVEFHSKEFGKSIEFIWLHKNKIKEENFLPGMEIALLKATESNY